MKRVGVIVPCHNYARFLAKSLDSIYRQEWENIEVVVVDDGSHDNPMSVAREYPCTLIAHEEPRGVCATINTGLEWMLTGGESLDYLAINSADDEWTPGRLKRQVEAMEASPQVGLLYGEIELIDENRVPLGRLGVPDTPATQQEAIDSLMAMNFVSGGTTLTRASMLSLVYPIPAFACYEDWWMAVQIAAHAEPWPTVVKLPEPAVLRYRQHGANMTAAAPEVSWGREVEFRRWLLTDGPHHLASPVAIKHAREKLEHMEKHGREC